uniref:Disease resistance N-terminal domain-containing protein n=1 Tax=Aegilops tauschii TaxID=37682 RepID=R7W946_AEGTA
MGLNLGLGNRWLIKLCIECECAFKLIHACMAWRVVSGLILKLGYALLSEVVKLAGSLFGVEGYALKGLFCKIRHVKGELESIQAFLHAAESFWDTDETTAAFVGQIRTLSFNVDDVVDEFTYELVEDGRGILILKAIRRVRQIKIWYRLAGRLRDTKADLRSAAERRGRYDLKGIQRDTRLLGRNGSDWSCLIYTSFEAQDDPVGIEEQSNFLM